MTAKRQNLVESSVESPAPGLTGTTLTLEDGTDFPDTGWYAVGIRDHSSSHSSKNNTEFCLASRSGDTLTLIRAQFGSTARNIGVNDVVYLAAMSPDDGHTINPATGGKFMDFAPGAEAEGVTLTALDPPSPDWWDSLSYTAGSSTLVYSAAQLLPPIPAMVKITNSAAVPVAGTWSATTYPALTTHYGRVYLYLDDANTSNIRLITWGNSGSPASCFLVLTSAQKFQISNGTSAQTLSTGGTTSQVALAAGTGVHYRLEWEYIYGSPGTVRVKVFIGHEVDPTDDFTATFNNGTSALTLTYGHNNNASLSSKAFRLGAIAGACSYWPGPYTATHNNAFQIVHDGLGSPVVEFTTQGELQFRTPTEFTLSEGGGLYRYHNLPGDVITTIGPRGLRIGANKQFGNFATLHPSDNQDIILSAADRRLSVPSQNMRMTEDPADLTQTRFTLVQSANNSSFMMTGSGASTTAGSDEVTFSDFTVSMSYLGNTIDLGASAESANDGTTYTITKILGPNKVRVSTAQAATASGVVWQLKAEPYGNYSGSGSGLLIGEYRFSPQTFDYQRSGTITTTANSASAVVTGFTSADIGRRLSICRWGAQLSSDGTAPADGDTVTINDQTYRFKNTMAAANDVLRSTSSDACLDNLIAAVNQTGGNYFAGTVAPTGVRAKVRTGTGSSGKVRFLGDSNYASTETSSHFSFGGATFSDSVANLDPTLVKGGGNTCFEITAVAADTPSPGQQTLTLNAQVTTSLTSVTCVVSGSEQDDGGDQVETATMNISYRTLGDTVELSSDGHWYATDGRVEITGIDPDAVWKQESSNIRQLFQSFQDGRVLVGVGPLGYADPAGGSVTQATNKSTAVTINAACGKITMNNATLNAQNAVSFTVNNSLVTADDTVRVDIRSGATANSYIPSVTAHADGSFVIQLFNCTAATNLSEAVVLNFAVLRGDS